MFEFGAGKNLAQNIYLSSFVKNQIVVDLNFMIELDLVELARRSIAALHVDLPSNKKIETLADLSEYGIDYRAPCDASATGIDDESVDICVSTNTLEHIPEDTIADILKELYRMLRKDCLISAKIDYSDHYAHTDPSISRLNFLRYTDQEWDRYNHRCHYQNRLRHADYCDLFERAGFVMISEELIYAEKNLEPEVVERFAESPATWRATGAYVLYRKATHPE